MRQLSKEDRQLLNEELEINTKLAEGVNSEFCKTLLKIIENSIDSCEKEWISRGISVTYEGSITDLRIAIRSKVLTLRSLKTKILSSVDEAKRLQIELNE